MGSFKPPRGVDAYVAMSRGALAVFNDRRRIRFPVGETAGMAKPEEEHPVPPRFGTQGSSPLLPRSK